VGATEGVTELVSELGSPGVMVSLFTMHTPDVGGGRSRGSNRGSKEGEIQTNPNTRRRAGAQPHMGDREGGMARGSPAWPRGSPSPPTSCAASTYIIEDRATMMAPTTATASGGPRVAPLAEAPPRLHDQ